MGELRRVHTLAATTQNHGGVCSTLCSCSWHSASRWKKPETKLTNMQALERVAAMSLLKSSSSL